MGQPRLLTQEVADRVAHLQVRASRAVDGLRSGIHRSPHRGASVIFAEHRDYRPGDDMRLLDWRAYARNDRFTIKHFEQETHLRAHLLLDRSASMDYDGGATDTHKGEYGAALLSALGLVLARQGDAVGAAVFADSVAEQLPARARTDHLDSILELLSRPPEPGLGTDLGGVLAELSHNVGRRGFVAIASDLLDFGERPLQPLKQLTALGHEVLVLHVMHPDELELPFREPMRFEDPESDESLDADPVTVRSGYMDELGKFMEKCRRRCTSAGCRYTLARTDMPIQQVLAQALLSAGSRWG